MGLSLANESETSCSFKGLRYRVARFIEKQVYYAPIQPMAGAYMWRSV